jgi:hypothetical protein
VGNEGTRGREGEREGEREERNQKSKKYVVIFDKKKVEGVFKTHLQLQRRKAEKEKNE